MLKTRRYEYLPFARIRFHPGFDNHRHLNWAKVNHYERDIAANGLFEPLVVWEADDGAIYLVGGFHRHAAIQAIRGRHPGWFEYVDARVVEGQLDEIRALNLKLNADRLDARITEFFDVVVHLARSGWSVARIAEFLDRPEAWIAEILRFAPGMDPRVRAALEDGRLSWGRARRLGRAVEAAAPDAREALVRAALAEASAPRRARRLTARSALRRMERAGPAADAAGSVPMAEVRALLRVLAGGGRDGADWERVRAAFPFLAEPARRRGGVP